MAGKIFISYSKMDPKPTEALAEFLETKGYSIWWDTGLIPGDSFGTVIDRELDAADAVIVIWTPQSVSSEWVLSEAIHARRMNKLIPLRTATLDPRQIPKPFGTIHTGLVDDRTSTLAAVRRLAGEGATTIEVKAQQQQPRIDKETPVTNGSNPLVIISFIAVISIILATSALSAIYIGVLVLSSQFEPMLGGIFGFTVTSLIAFFCFWSIRRASVDLKKSWRQG